MFLFVDLIPVMFLVVAGTLYMHQAICEQWQRYTKLRVF